MDKLSEEDIIQSINNVLKYESEINSAPFKIAVVKGLLDLYQKEKEKNKELETKLELSKKLYDDACICLVNTVSKDKINEKIEEINNEELNYSEDEYWLEQAVKGYAIDNIKELLEE